MQCEFEVNPIAGVNSVNQITISADCVRAKSKKASCRECVECCPRDALLITDSNEIAVDFGRCNKCGSCVAACPVEAIEGALPSRKTVDNVLYADFNSVPTVKELLLYYHADYRQIAIPDDESPWLVAVARANQMLAQLDLAPFTIKFDPLIIPEQVSKGRRSFLRLDLIGHQLAKPPIDNMPLTQCAGEYQFFNVALDRDSCTLCSACLRLCPTAALKYEKQHFLIDNGRCVGCKLCQDTCPEHALQVTDSVKLKTISAYPFIAHCCCECKQNYLSVSENSTLCAACRVKKALNLTGPGIGMHSLNFRSGG